MNFFSANLMDFLFTYLIPFILGSLVVFIIKFLIYKYSKSENSIIFTKDISTNVITFTKDYQEILTTRLGDDTDYFITYGTQYYYFLTSDWTIFDVKSWLNSLSDQDYAITIELISNNSEEIFPSHHRVILSKEFIVNKHSNPLIISTLISNGVENIYNMFNHSNKNKNHYILIKYTILMTSN